MKRELLCEIVKCEGKLRSWDVWDELLIGKGNDKILNNFIGLLKFEIGKFIVMKMVLLCLKK